MEPRLPCKIPKMAICGESLLSNINFMSSTCRKIRSEGNFMAVSMASKAII